MPPKMSKTAAIKATQNSVVICKSNPYHVCGPYRIDEPEGPKTEFDANSWRAARTLATRWRVEIVLCMMGYDDDDALFAVHLASLQGRITDLSGLIDAGIAAARLA